MRQDILDYLMENQGTFVSGQKISELFGISRTAVWKHIRVLKQRGYALCPGDLVFPYFAAYLSAYGSF